MNAAHPPPTCLEAAHGLQPTPTAASAEGQRNDTALVDAALLGRAAPRACDVRSHTALVNAALHVRAAPRACDVRSHTALVNAALHVRAAPRACCVRTPAVIKSHR